MLWASLRWNWPNTAAVAAFCLLALLGAANSEFFSAASSGRGPADGRAYSALCDKRHQPGAGAPRVDATADIKPSIQPEALGID